ncbi:hypothetical protein BKA70DRAFT_1402345 [Coprinopsis sp. MPI-PUGE-AT-0042]|nr:hypothetical protein BKA70DRAFT_1402345 [Coprinopsis sp. MPI-PUGE-AT-0042]
MAAVAHFTGLIFTVNGSAVHTLVYDREDQNSSSYRYLLNKRKEHPLSAEVPISLIGTKNRKNRPAKTYLTQLDERRIRMMAVFKRVLSIIPLIDTGFVNTDGEANQVTYEHKPETPELNEMSVLERLAEHWDSRFRRSHGDQVRKGRRRFEITKWKGWRMGMRKEKKSSSWYTYRENGMDHENPLRVGPFDMSAVWRQANSKPLTSNVLCSRRTEGKGRCVYDGVKIRPRKCQEEAN